MHQESVLAGATRLTTAILAAALLVGDASADEKPRSEAKAGTAKGPDAPAAAAPRPWGRAEYVAFFSSGRRLDPIEGIWVFPDNSAEIAIARYAPGTGGEFEYFGQVVASSSWIWQMGTPVLFVKSTAAPSVFVGRWMPRGGPGGATLVVRESNLMEILAVDQKELLVRLYPKVPGDAATGGAATGFFVARGIVATNSHVVEDAKVIKVRIGEVEALADVALRDAGSDLALLRLRSDGKLDAALAAQGERCAVLGDALSIKPGDRVYTLGFPLGQLLGKSLKVSEGIVSSTTGMQNDPTVFQVSVPIQPGSSGSPVFDAHGRVIAIVTGSLNAKALLSQTGTAPQNVNFAVKAVYLRTLLSFLTDASCGGPVAARSLSAAELQQALGRAVVQVRVED